MASGITLSAGVRQNLLALQQTGTLSATTQNRLATGKKVNSALDNPTNFFTSSSLGARSNDLSSLLDSMSNGIKTLEAADNGLSSITKTVESMQSTLRQARQDKSFQTVSYDVSSVDPNASQGGKLTFSGGAFTTATDFDMTTTGAGKQAATTSNFSAPSAAATASTVSNASINLTTGNVTGGKLTIGYQGNSVEIDVAAATTPGAAATATAITNSLKGTALEGKVNVAASGTGISITAAVASQDGTITVSGTSAASLFGAEVTNVGSNGKTEFSVNGTAVSLDATTGADADAAAAETNRLLKADGAKFQAFNSGGKLAIRATSTDSGALAIGGADAGLFGTPSGGVVAGTTSSTLKLAKTVDDLVSSINGNSALKDNIKASNDNGKLRIQNLSTAELSISGATSDGKATGKPTDTTGSIAGNDVRKNLVSQFNQFRDQLDKLSDDASFNGINLLRGDKLKITFNENATSSIDIQAKDATGATRAISASNLDIDTAVNKDFDSDTTLDAKLDVLSTALNTLRSQAGSFGSNLAIVQNRQDFTKSMMNTLQTGADNLVLADTNEEGANMLALQTRQQLATTALSMANQANQAVLRLF